MISFPHMRGVEPFCAYYSMDFFPLIKIFYIYPSCSVLRFDQLKLTYALLLVSTVVDTKLNAPILLFSRLALIEPS